MTTEQSPLSVSEEPKSCAEKPGLSPEAPQNDSDSLPVSDCHLPHQHHHHHKSNASPKMPDDTHSLHSMANGGQDGKSDPKSKSLVPSSGREGQSAPVEEVKSEPSELEKEEISSVGQALETDRQDPVGETGASEKTLVDHYARGDFSPHEERPPSSTQEETEASVDAGRINEYVPEEPIDEEQNPSIAGPIEESSDESAPTREEIPPGEPLDPIQENPALLSTLPPPKKSVLRSLTTRRLKDDELKEKVVIPSYLSQGMVNAIQAAGVVAHDAPRINNVKAPESPLLVFINSKSGGRLGPGLEALLVDLIAATQVYDLSKCKPADVLRYGLGYLEQEADAGDTTAFETRNSLRIMVAGGDGTVGWVLGLLADVEKERFKVPPVGVMPLGTGNDLSRSFGWGGSTSSISRRAVKRWLIKSTEAEVCNLDSWQVVVKPAPTRQEEPLKLPYALHPMQPQHHIPLENPTSNEEETATVPFFEGSFWNYFSIGMDAQVAYGFHHLRDEAPWLAGGRISNQMVYGGYSCVQGWFCTPCAAAPVQRGLRQILKVLIKKSHDIEAEWEELELPANIRAVVVLNLQSYAGGRNPWGKPSSARREKEGYCEAGCDDGVLEIVGLVDGWHTAFVLLDWFTAVRLCQARAVKLELKGKGHRNKAYLQMDGEPWQQPLGEESEPPAIVEINCHPVKSICLRK